MPSRDQIAIRAASAQIRLINHIAEHPRQPVPAEIIRDSMEANNRFFIAHLADSLERSHPSVSVALNALLNTLDEPDPLPDSEA